jgi:caffeoyl-CoA O-methyltransferase
MMSANRIREVMIGITFGAAMAIVGCMAQNPRATERRSDEATKSGNPHADPLPAKERGTEKKILAVLDDMYRNQREGMLNAPPEDCRLIRILVEATRAKHVVEIGTSNGYSGVWICLALRATGGHLTTHEIDPKRAALARENFARAGVQDLVTLVEGDAHKEVEKLKGSIDVLFIDADKTGYIDYLNKLLPLVRPGGLILAHNTRNCARDMKDYIQAVTTNPDLETVLLNENEQGMGVTLKKKG